MALETLKGVTEIGGFAVLNMDDLRKKRPDDFIAGGQMKTKIFEKEFRGKNFIQVRNDKNSISFTIQNGPVKDNGVNGCQVDTMIAAAALIILRLDKNFPCQENKDAIRRLEGAMLALRLRKENREKRGVEGENKL